MIFFFMGLFYAVNFLLQLWIATFLFSGRMEQKEGGTGRFVLFCAAAVLVGAVSYYFLSLSDQWIIYNTIYYLLLFLCGVVAVWGSFEVSFGTALDISTTGYIVQNMTSQISQMILRNIVFTRDDIAVQYGADLFRLPREGMNLHQILPEDAWIVGFHVAGLQADNVPGFLIYLLTIPILAICYAVLYFIFSGRMQRANYTQKTRQNLLLLSGVSLVVVLLISSYRDVHASESTSLMVASRLLSIMCCLLLLIMKTGILELNTVEQESQTLQRLRVQEREQYERQKETIDLINVKCHDMRHQIDRLEKLARRGDLRNTGESLHKRLPADNTVADNNTAVVNVSSGNMEAGNTATEVPDGTIADFGELSEMKRLIRIYDSSIKTGNETLDTILTEQSLICEKYNIRFSCIADGSRLDFMSVGDICSLFGNAIENAVQAVQKLSDPEDRIISLRVEEKGGMLLIRLDNSYTGKVVYDGDLPRTTKVDHPGYHGYGLKSIRMTAEKYGGIMKIQTDDHFTLTVMIPRPE